MTLLEVLLTTTLTAFVLIAVVGIFGFITRQWNRQVGRSQALQTANLGMDMMAKEIRNAVSCSIDSSGTSAIFTFPAKTDRETYDAASGKYYDSATGRYNDPAKGNFIPEWSGDQLQYPPGSQIRFYLSDTTGQASGGSVLWRARYATVEYLLVLTSGTWMPDSAWSLLPGSPARGKVAGVTTLAFSTAGLPPNTVRITLTVRVREGKRTSHYTVRRDVFLSNRN